MKALILFVAWCILLVLAWPVALLVLVLVPFVWLLSLPFRLVGLCVGAVFARIVCFLPIIFLDGGLLLPDGCP